MRPSTFPDHGSAGEDAESPVPRAGSQPALRLPVPVPLLLQLCRPLNTLDDVESLAAQLRCARARGCF
jgi:hypothetical protein